jgi:hypothetical protein
LQIASPGRLDSSRGGIAVPDLFFVIGGAPGVRPWAASTYEAHKFARPIRDPGARHTVGEAFFPSDDPAPGA